MRTIIKGVKIKSCDLQTIEQILNKVQTKIEMRAKNLYASLLANVIETLVDDISFNVIKRPENESIYDCASNDLNRRISWATEKNVPTPYNFSVQAAIFTYKCETYIQFNIANEILRKELGKIPNTEDFTLYDIELNTNEERGEIWEEIRQIYAEQNLNPMVRQLFPVGPIEVEWKKVESKLHTREERAKQRAEYQLISADLNMIAMDSEIPNFKLLRYLDEVGKQLMSEEAKYEIQQIILKALPIIVNITEAEIKRKPNEQLPHTFEAMGKVEGSQEN